MPATRKREPVYAFGEHTLAPGLHHYFRWHLEGLEHVPKDGPAIVASNHLSYLDGLSVAFGVHRAGRRPRFLTKSSLFKVPVVGAALHAIGQIPVVRGTREAPQSLEHAEMALNNGEVVVIFIEGTTSTTPDLALGKPKTGAARLALATGKDIIPCATWGGQWIWTKHLGVHLKPRQEVWVRFGPPVSVAPWAGREGERQAWQELSEVVMERIAGMLADLRAAKPWAPQAPTRRKFIEEQEAKKAADPATVAPRAEGAAAEGASADGATADGASEAETASAPPSPPDDPEQAPQAPQSD
jgi:1-acyl-sn-glycerol-3-phosphate acyltransferase